MRKIGLSLSLALFALGANAYCEDLSKLQIPQMPPQADVLVLKKLDALVNPQRDIGSVSLTLKAAGGLPKSDTFCPEKVEHLTIDRVPDFFSGLELVVSFAR